MRRFPSIFLAVLASSAGVVTAADYSYVADLDPNANYVTEVAPDGTLVRPWRYEQGTISGLASDGQGTLYVAHFAPGQFAIDKIGHGAVTSRVITGASRGPITLDPGGNLYVADAFSQKIFKITPGRRPNNLRDDSQRPRGTGVRPGRKPLRVGLGTFRD